MDEGAAACAASLGAHGSSSGRVRWRREGPYEILRSVEGGAHYLLLRFDRPVATVIPHADYLAFSELARKDALARALLQGKGYDPAKLTAQEFLDLLGAHVKEGSDAGK